MIPEHLRPHLEKLGAQITPLSDGATEVQIPGAKRRWRFELSPRRYLGLQEQRHLSIRQVDVPGEKPKTWHTGVDLDGAQGLETHQLLSHISDGFRSHDGPQHMLAVGQHVVPDGQSYRLAVRTHLITDPDTASEQVFFNPDNRQHEQLGKAVLEGQAPIEVLADELADHHNVSHLVRSEPQQYAKSYAAAIKS